MSLLSVDFRVPSIVGGSRDFSFQRARGRRYQTIYQRWYAQLSEQKRNVEFRYRENVLWIAGEVIPAIGMAFARLAQHVQTLVDNIFLFLRILRNPGAALVVPATQMTAPSLEISDDFAPFFPENGQDSPYVCLGSLDGRGIWFPFGWELHPVELEVDGRKIHGMKVGKAKHLNNGKWVLYSSGNGQFFEHTLLYSDDFYAQMDHFEYNVLLFHYPGVGKSEGPCTKERMVKSYSALLSFLENEMSAKEIIGWGFSIGGGVQGEALKEHQLKETVRYCFVKDRTFSDLSSAARDLVRPSLIGVIAAQLVRAFAWDFSSVESSRELKAPEVIIQTGEWRDAALMKESGDLSETDEIITKNASLAHKLFSDFHSSHNKKFIVVPEWHCGSLSSDSVRLVLYTAQQLMSDSGNFF
ncbi:MAG: hypothetical protein KGI80_00775 [Verrucomicrobiota bacterium]|nr:hypothetical protein [Verrucomicrobiota bacterium]